MKRIIGTALIVFSLSLAGSSGELFAQSPSCNPTFFANARFIYSVKFVCGLQTFTGGAASLPLPGEPPAKPGNYATSVNIHNYLPIDITAQVCKKAVVALTEAASKDKPGPISPFVFDQFPPNAAKAVTCADIVGLFPGVSLPMFIEGFVEILSPVSLSVTAVYTSQSCHNPVAGKTCRSLGELAIEVEPQTPLPPPG